MLVPLSLDRPVGAHMKTIADLPYRPCVGVALFNRDGLVWVGRRSDEEAEGEGKGQLVADAAGRPRQGRGPRRRRSPRALRRDLGQEASARSPRRPDGSPTICRPHLVPTSWNGKYRGQKQKWFAFRFEGEEREIDVAHPGGGKHKPEFSEWRWERLDRLPALVVPFKRTVYEDVVAAFRDIPGRR